MKAQKANPKKKSQALNRRALKKFIIKKLPEMPKEGQVFKEEIASIFKLFFAEKEKIVEIVNYQ